jgi:hypothetical protein
LQYCDLQGQKSEIGFHNTAMPEAISIKIKPLGSRFQYWPREKKN